MRVQELAGPAPLKAAFRAGLPKITSKDPDEPIFWVLADLFWPASAFKDPVSSFKNRRHIKLISCAGFFLAGDGFKNHPAHIKNAPRDIFRSVKGIKKCVGRYLKSVADNSLGAAGPAGSCLQSLAEGISGSCRIWRS